MQTNKLTFWLGLAAVALAAFLAWHFLVRGGGNGATETETYSFSGKVKSVDASTVVVESYAIVPDPTGTNPPRVETRDRSVRVSSRTQVFRKAVAEGEGSKVVEARLSDIGPGKDVVIYSEDQAEDGKTVFAKSVEITN